MAIMEKTRGRPKDTFWLEKIRAEAQNNPSRRAGQIRRELQRQLRQGQITPPPGAGKDPPSEKTIRRIKSEFAVLPEVEKAEYKWLSWPESFANGALPWESSRACLDLLRVHIEEGRNPPTNTHALWFWRVTQAAPAAPLEERVRVTEMINRTEQSQDRKLILKEYAARLTFEPWASKSNEKAYDEWRSQNDSRYVRAGEWPPKKGPKNGRSSSRKG